MWSNEWSSWDALGMAHHSSRDLPPRLQFLTGESTARPERLVRTTEASICSIITDTKLRSALSVSSSSSSWGTEGGHQLVNMSWWYKTYLSKIDKCAAAHLFYYTIYLRVSQNDLNMCFASSTLFLIIYHLIFTLDEKKTLTFKTEV